MTLIEIETSHEGALGSVVHRSIDLSEFWKLRQWCPAEAASNSSFCYPCTWTASNASKGKVEPVDGAKLTVDGAKLTGGIKVTDPRALLQRTASNDYKGGKVEPRTNKRREQKLQKKREQSNES
jgi:hypothetical protein